MAQWRWTSNEIVADIRLIFYGEIARVKCVCWEHQVQVSAKVIGWLRWGAGKGGREGGREWGKEVWRWRGHERESHRIGYDC